jgi:hypothetical protein
MPDEKVWTLEEAVRAGYDRNPGYGSTWVNLKSNKMVRVLGSAVRESDLCPLVVYREMGDMMGVHWVLPLGEFMDGRFQPKG